MAYFYRKDGSVNLSRLTVSTATILGTYMFSFFYSIKQVRDPGMDPLLMSQSQVFDANEKSTMSSRILGFFLADKVLYKKMF